MIPLRSSMSLGLAWYGSLACLVWFLTSDGQHPKNRAFRQLDGASIRSLTGDYSGMIPGAFVGFF